jgi:hypothetical protein
MRDFPDSGIVYTSSSSSRFLFSSFFTPKLKSVVTLNSTYCFYAVLSIFSKNRGIPPVNWDSFHKSKRNTYLLLQEKPCAMKCAMKLPEMA